MSIPYRLTEVKDNINDKPKKTYYAKVITRGTVDTLMLCRDIASKCTLTVADVRAAIEAISESMGEFLKDGYNVYIDSLGTFSISAETKKHDEENDDDDDQIEEKNEPKGQQLKVKNINFRPSVRMKDDMKEASFIRETEERQMPRLARRRR